MSYATNRERQELGFRQFLETHLKEAKENRNLKNTIKLYGIFVFAIAIMLAFESYRVLGIVLGCSILAILGAYKIIMIISKKKAKNITLPSNIEKVEHIFEEVYESKTYFVGGSVNSMKYEYSDIFKIVEGIEFYYIYINPFTAIPLDKKSVNDIEEFTSFIKGKNVLLKELKINEG